MAERVVGFVVESDRGAYTIYEPTPEMVERAARALAPYHGQAVVGSDGVWEEDHPGWTGVDPQAAFAELPTLLDIDGGDIETAQAGRDAGLTFTLAWELAFRNDSTLGSMTPEQRYDAFMKWLDEQLETEAVAA